LPSKLFEKLSTTAKYRSPWEKDL